MKCLENRLTGLERLGYGIGSVGETILYILYSFYAMFFLTEIAKINTVTAGTIISMSTIVNAFFVIYLGYKSDNCRSKSGRRIPFMKAAILPAILFSLLCFSAIDVPQTLKVPYYTIAVLGMIAMHTLFVLPYEALGAEITDNLKERNSIRNYAKFFMGIGTLLGLSLTSLLVDFFSSARMSQAKSWQSAVAVVIGISALCLVSTVLILRKKAARSRYIGSDAKKSSIVKEYWSVIRIKPFQYLLAITALCSMNFAFSSPAMIYYMSCNMGLAGRYQSVVFIVITLANIVFTPITAHLVKRIGKERAMCLSFIISGVALIVFSFWNLKSFASLAVLAALLTVGNSAYYQLIFPMYYDISILDNHWNNKQREGTILSTAKTVLRIFTALGTQLLAVLLACFGYDEMASVQSSSALTGIKAAFMLVPGVLYLAAALCVRIYPITEETIKKIVSEKEE